MLPELNRLVALSPPRSADVNAAVRKICAGAVGLRPLPAEGDASGVAPAVVEFAEQFSVDVSVISDAQRDGLSDALGERMFGAVVLMYIADFVPRVAAGLRALGVGVSFDDVEWDHSTDLSAAVFNGFLPAVARLRALDPLTTELVRLRGAAQHNCRLCKSLREGSALDAGGSETLYGEIAGFESSGVLTASQKAALRYVDALVWTPAHIPADVAAGVRAHFSETEAVELTLDVMRNAANKIAVSLAADAPRVESGTERYLVGADGQTVFDGPVPDIGTAR